MKKNQGFWGKILTHQSVLGSPIIQSASCSSTLDFCEDLTFVYGEKTVLFSNFQTHGQGRLDHTWESSYGKNLLFSVCFHQSNINSPVFLSPALAICSYLKTLSLNPYIKWPNDILIDHHKIAGIIVFKKNDYFLLGIGINVNQILFNKPDTYAYPPSSLALCHKHFTPQQVLFSILEWLKIYCLIPMSVEQMLTHAHPLLYGKTHPLPYIYKNKTILGKTLYIKKNGALVVQGPSGLVEINY